ncbi:hypothetical protein B0H12DRAFT_1073368 [Mycena haematopus]|nr:hypothetical protein B0H12DRAFT_1073368 [Mycena haematopus]
MATPGASGMSKGVPARECRTGPWVVGWPASMTCKKSRANLTALPPSSPSSTNFLHDDDHNVRASGSLFKFLRCLRQPVVVGLGTQNERHLKADGVGHHCLIWTSRGMTWLVGSAKLGKKQKPTYVPSFTKKYPLGHVASFAHPFSLHEVRIPRLLIEHGERSSNNVADTNPACLRIASFEGYQLNKHQQDGEVWGRGVVERADGPNGIGHDMHMNELVVQQAVAEAHGNDVSLVVC